MSMHASKTLLSAKNFHQMQNVQGKLPLTLPEMNRTHGSLPASATSFVSTTVQNG